MASPDKHGTEPGPRDDTDDATKADMGLTGTPDRSMTPAGQGDHDGTGAHEKADADDDRNAATPSEADDDGA